MQFIDLKYFLPIGHTSAPLRKEMDNHEYRQNRLCPTDGILSLLRIPEMRRAVRRKLQGEIVHLPGPVSLYGLRSAHVPGKPSGYRGLPAWSKTEAISHGHPEQGLQKYHCPCQRDARLANLRRLCPGADQDRERAVRRRGLRPGTGSDRIRLRFNDPRSLSLGLSVGHVPQGEGRDQAAYASGSPRQYPVIIRITPAKIHDVNILDDLLFEAGAIYIFDRGYVDFARLYRIHQSRAFFLTRAKSNFVFKRLYSQPVDKSTGVRADQIITVTGFYTLKDYPEKLRRIRYFDSATKKRLIFLTNNFDLPAITIAQLYKCRWQVELFFKWIKQHLRIKAFYGTTENAVKTQIWIAISIYVLWL